MRLCTRVVPRPELTAEVGHDTIDLHIGFGRELDVWSMDRHELRTLIVQAQAALDVYEPHDAAEPEMLDDVAPAPVVEVPEPAAPVPDYNRLPFHKAKHAVMRRWETEYFTALRERFNGNKSRMAVVAGIDRRSLYRKLVMLGMEKPGARFPEEEFDEREREAG